MLSTFLAFQSLTDINPDDENDCMMDSDDDIDVQPEHDSAGLHTCSGSSLAEAEASTMSQIQVSSGSSIL